MENVLLYLHCYHNPSQSRSDIHRGPDALQWFRREMETIVEEYTTKINNLVPMYIRDDKYEAHCHICRKDLEQKRATDHCHPTGKFRVMAHLQWNLMYQLPKIL